MPSPHVPADLLDLKILPAWVSEPSRPNAYADFEGEEFGLPEERGFRRKPDDHRRNRPRRDKQPRDRRDQRRPQQSREREPRRAHPPGERHPLPEVSVRFLPHPPAFNNVVAQIKSGSVAYSVFALARLFLEKPERYDVRLTAKEGQSLHQLGGDGAVATDRRFLEDSAFTAQAENFFQIETTQSEPLKGNFTNVARDRLSGTLLGPTNYHSYQPQLRNLYEQRFSRRMSFADFQRQIEIVSDSAVVDQWKDQARNVTTYTTTNEQSPVKFTSQPEADRYFRQKYLPDLLREAAEVTIGGVLSRRLPDRALNRAIEEAWVRETRSPSHMMQELASGFRQAGLNIFRHRRGMLFVSPIRARAFGHENDAVSPSVKGVLEKIAAVSRINRKQLADELANVDGDADAAQQAKLTLASDLRWLISEGYVIEFNDGSLDLPRVRKPEPIPTSTVIPTTADSTAQKDDSAKALETNASETSAESPVAMITAIPAEATEQNPG